MPWFGRGGKGGSQGPQQERDLTRIEEMLDESIAEVERALGVWKRLALSEPTLTHLIPRLDDFARRISRAKTADDVRLIREEINAFTAPYAGRRKK